MDESDAKATEAKKQAAISEVAERALAEAEARKRAEGEKNPGPKEVGGRQGPDPVRYGDWENKGIASDF